MNQVSKFIVKLRIRTEYNKKKHKISFISAQNEKRRHANKMKTFLKNKKMYKEIKGKTKLQRLFVELKLKNHFSFTIKKKLNNYNYDACFFFILSTIIIDIIKKENAYYRRICGIEDLVPKHKS